MSITLAQLEQATARRVGPYWVAFADRQVPNTASFTFANFPELRSEIDLDSVTNLYLLRRGVLLDGTPVAFDIADRQRLVSSYDPESGRVYPDRPWGTIPQPGEVCEFHHLNPQLELRMAVLAGLRRCFLPDNVQAQPTALWGGIDLTEQFPWLTDPWQIARVRYGWMDPWQDAPWDTYTRLGHLILTGTYGQWQPIAVWLDVWRPSWALVNGLDSDVGPVADDDILEVDLDYAAAAGHIEAWHLFPSRLQVAAAGGTQATQAMAAAEFSREAGIYGPGRSTSVGFNSVVRGTRGHSWVNAPW